MLLLHRIRKAGKNAAHVCLALSLLFTAGCANSQGASTVYDEIMETAKSSAIETDKEATASSDDAAFARTNIPPVDETGSQTAAESTFESTVEAGQGTAGMTPFELHGALSVSGTQLVDKNGDAFQIKGVSTHGLSWYPEYVNENAFLTLRDQWGVNTIRLAMYTAENDGYCTGDEVNREELKALIDAAVGYAENLGMYVIIDWHILSDSNPDIYKKESLAFFDEMTARYSSYDNVIYEICNEPNSGTTWEQIKSYAVEVISVIREKDPNAVILVGTPTWSQDVDAAAADPINDTNIMYTLHFYADTHRDSLRQKLSDAVTAGLPVFVSEFGICSASGSGSINSTEAQKWIDLLDEGRISYVIWNLSNKDETSALISNDVTKTSDWTFEELSESGRWFYLLMTGE